MKLKDIVKTKREIDDIGYDIANNIITNVNINTIAHFGNFTVYPKSSLVLISSITITSPSIS